MKSSGPCFVFPKCEKLIIYDYLVTAQIVVYEAESKGNSQLAVLKTLYHQRLKEVGSPCDNEINSIRVFF